MGAEELEGPGFRAGIESSSASSIYVSWAVQEEQLLQRAVIQGYRVHYQKVASSYVQYSHFLSPSHNTYTIDNLVADTYYKVCVVMYRNDTSSPARDCVDASTSAWHIPVSIGSSIGAVLALSIIVLIVLLSRCPSLLRHQRASASESSRYDSMTSSRYPDDHNDLSDTTTQCPDHDDDVFTEHSENDPLECGRPCVHYPHYPDRLCNGKKNHAFVGAAPGVMVPSHVHQHTRRPHSVGTCARTNSLEKPRHHYHRHHHHCHRSHLMQLHNTHQSIQSEPAAPPSQLPEARSVQVSISDLPPSVHVPDQVAPVSSISTGAVAGGGARAKTQLNDAAQTLHMSIDSDV